LIETRTAPRPEIGRLFRDRQEIGGAELALAATERDPIAAWAADFRRRSRQQPQEQNEEADE